MHFRKVAAIIIALVFVVTACLPARADQIVLKNGRTLSGEVAAEDDQSVTLEVSGPGMTFKQRVQKVQIAKWDRPAQVGSAYVLVPVLGEIGVDCTAATMKAALDAAREAKPKYIVLVVDSGGGSVQEMLKIIDLLDQSSKETEIVAYVQHAYSAAAVIAMSRPKIYLKSDASIGAAVPYKMTPKGPADLEAKFRSPIEAEFRRVAAHAGHSELLVRGMLELDLPILLSQENGKPTLSTSGGGKVIKSKGQILTLTADEAAECGLSQTAADFDSLGKSLTGGSWHEASHRAWNLVTAMTEQHRRETIRQQATERIRPQWNAIEAQLARLTSKYAALQEEMDKLTASVTAELRHIDSDYKDAVTSASKQPDAKSAAARAAETRNALISKTRANYQRRAAVLTTEADATRIQIEDLHAREKQLLATLPAD